MAANINIKINITIIDERDLLITALELGELERFLNAARIMGMQCLYDVFLFVKLSLNVTTGANIPRAVLRCLERRFRDEDKNQGTSFAIIDLIVDIAGLYKCVAAIYNDDIDLERYGLNSWACMTFMYRLLPFWNGGSTL